MVDQVLNLFCISPDFDFDLMLANQTPSQVAGRVLLALDSLMKEFKPDWVLVQGDTTSVMATALAAHHLRVKVAHVEAGLRTYDRLNPFPEELNRVVADYVSDLHFAPTANARDNLLHEMFNRDSIFVTGNTVIDALHWVMRQPLQPIATNLLENWGITNHRENGNSDSNHSSNQPGSKSLILVTAHRRESFGKPIRNICKAVRILSARDDVQIVYLVHPNPNIWGPVHKLLGGLPGITLLPPVDYLTLVQLMKHSRLILTDSGGIQEEAPSLGVPVLVMRKKTERPEAVAAGVAKLVGTETDSIVLASQNLIENSSAHEAMARAINPYGDGNAARRIAEVLVFGHCEEFYPEIGAFGYTV
jgi:UDP-N-acetylglucosamine 2-epimerase (non-hydrolysing)